MAVLVLWSLGALAMLLPVLIGRLGILRLERRCGPLEDGRIRHLATRVALRLGTHGRYRLLVGPRECMPMTWGVVRPRVVLPVEALEWSEPRLEAVLSHELAHVARRDVLTQYLAELVRAIHWFNPLAWVAAWRLRVEREHACDDVALAVGSRPSDYAEELLGLARRYRATAASSLAAVAMARPGQLADRLLAVLDDTRRRSRLRRGAAVWAGVAAVLLVVPLAALAPTAVAEVPGGSGTRASAGDRSVSDTRVDARPSTGAPAMNPGSLDKSEEAEASPRVTGGRDAGRAPAGPAPDIGLAGTSPPGLPTPEIRPVSSVGPAFQGRSCAAEDADWNEVSRRSHDDRQTITLSRRGCRLEVLLEGDVDFDGASIGIARMRGDARIRIEEDDGRTERRLDITPGRDGRPTFALRVNGRDAEFDSQEQGWYRAILLVLFRRAGFAAGERVTALLEQGGVDAVLRELDRLHSSYVLATYITLLGERADLSEGQWRGLVDLSFERVDSDYYLAQILGIVAANQPLTTALMDRFIAAAMRLDSDYYRTQVLTGVLQSGRLSTEQVGEVLRATTGMDSDYYRAAILTSVADRYALEPEFRRTYLAATADMDSDYYRAQVLARLLERDDLSTEEKAAVIRAADMMDSDHYRTEVLAKVAALGIREPALRRSFFETAAGLNSDHYYEQAMVMLLDQPSVEPDLIRDVLRSAARELDSDHYLTELLLYVLDHQAVTGDLRDTLLTAMDAIESDHYRGQVADALLRQDRG